MLKLLVDTNVLLDLELPDRPCNALAETLFAAAADDYVELYACASSYKDVDYIVRASLKRAGWEPLEAKARAFECARNARDSVVTLPLTGVMTDLAFELEEPDLEDALIRACAEITGLDGIVTSDEAAFSGSWVRKLTLAEAVAVATAEATHG